MRRVSVTKDRLYSKERKSIRNHERSNETTENPQRNRRKATQREVGNSPQHPGGRDPKPQSQGNPGGPSNKLEVLATGKDNSHYRS
jgi:hypothetical protein